jgi:hypothetical protein
MTATTTKPAPEPKAGGKKKLALGRNGIIAIGVVVLLAIGATIYFVVNSSPVPYDDDASIGQLALYDTHGNAVTSGSINDKPFVGWAVSLEKAPPPYDKAGRKAALMAYVPHQGVGPSGWGGDFMTGSTPYPDPNHPTARGTSQDISLANFIAEIPLQWDGFIQLRIYLGAPGEPGLTTKYVTADIQVTGDTWKLVRGASSAPGGVPSASAGP